MWVGLVLIGVALLCTLLVGLSVANLHTSAPVGGPLAVMYTLALMAVLWIVLGFMLITCHAGQSGVPGGFVVVVYVMGGVAEVASLTALTDRSTDPVAALGLRAGIVAIPLVLVLFAGFTI